MQRNFWYLFAGIIAVIGGSALRYTTGAHLSHAFGISFPVAGIIALRGLATCRGETHRSSYPLLSALLAIIWMGLVCLLVGTKGRTGLYSLYSQDVASHLAYAGEFIYKSGDIYHGFISLYGTVGLLTTIGNVSLINSLALSIYGTLGLALLFMAMAVVSLVPVGTPNRWIQILAIAAACSVSLFALDIPLFFYNIGEGFWAHLCSFVVIASLWAGYTTLSSSVARIAIAVISIALYRFSYGLNLGDLVVTVGALVIIESRSLSKLRAPVLLGGLSLLAVSVVCYQKLLPLAHLNGGIVQKDIGLSLTSSLIILAGLFVALACKQKNLPLYSQSARRFMLFAILFCSVSLLAELAYHWAELPERYYSFKYGLHRVIVLSFAAPVAAVWLIQELISQVRHSSSPTGISHQPLSPYRPMFGRAAVHCITLMCLLFGYTKLYNCYKIYRLGMGVSLTSPSSHFPDPLFSDPIVKGITTTLAERQAAYHGTLATNWGSLMFLNSFMLHQESGQAAKELAENISMHGLSHPPQGSCAFWIRDGYFRNPPPLPLEELRSSIANFEQRKDKTCNRGRDFRGRRYSLCYVCG